MLHTIPSTSSTSSAVTMPSHTYVWSTLATACVVADVTTLVKRRLQSGQRLSRAAHAMMHSTQKACVQPSSTAGSTTALRQMQHCGVSESSLSASMLHQEEEEKRVVHAKGPWSPGAVRAPAWATG